MKSHLRADVVCRAIVRVLVRVCRGSMYGYEVCQFLLINSLQSNRIHSEYVRRLRHGVYFIAYGHHIHERIVRYVHSEIRGQVVEQRGARVGVAQSSEFGDNNAVGPVVADVSFAPQETVFVKYLTIFNAELPHQSESIKYVVVSVRTNHGKTGTISQKCSSEPLW